MSDAGRLPSPLAGRRILLVVSGGIAAYKSLELVRLLKRAGASVQTVLTAGGAAFVTPLSLQTLTEAPVHTDLFSLTEASRIGHIELSRSADLVVVAPASADILARMAAGICDDLATTLLLATDTPILVAPAMNVRMWEHPATVENLARLIARGVRSVGPESGPMACNEYGAGRLAEPTAIAEAISDALAARPRPPAAAGGVLAGRRALVTAGPTHEPIDPVRYIANRSSGRQGYAIAAALAHAGAEVTLVSGPVTRAPPDLVRLIRVETAREMLECCRAALPVDVAVLAAAVADWRVVQVSTRKLKKTAGAGGPALELVANPDILASVAEPGPRRPRLVVGFAAETEDMIANATGKRARKGCDWILANDVSEGSESFGGEANTLHLITASGVEDWPRLDKRAIAERLTARIAQALA